MEWVFRGKSWTNPRPHVSRQKIRKLWELWYNKAWINQNRLKSILHGQKKYVILNRMTEIFLTVTAITIAIPKYKVKCQTPLCQHRRGKKRQNHIFDKIKEKDRFIYGGGGNGWSVCNNIFSKSQCWMFYFEAKYDLNGLIVIS